MVTAAQSRTHRGAPWPRPLMSRGQAGAQALRGQLALGAFPSFSPGPANGCRSAVSLVSRCSLSSSRNPAFRGLRRGTLSAACLPAPSAHCAPWSRHRSCCAPGPARRSRSPGPRGSAVCVTGRPGPAPATLPAPDGVTFHVAGSLQSRSGVGSPRDRGAPAASPPSLSGPLLWTPPAKHKLSRPADGSLCQSPSLAEHGA